MNYILLNCSCSKVAYSNCSECSLTLCTYHSWHLSSINTYGIVKPNYMNLIKPGQLVMHECMHKLLCNEWWSHYLTILFLVISLCNATTKWQLTMAWRMRKYHRLVNVKLRIPNTVSTKRLTYTRANFL